MSPDANERLTRRILGGLGVRPVGHQDPNAGDSGQVATAPAVPAQHGNRLPPWWEAKKPVGEAASPVPPKPTTRPRDWLDGLLDSNKPTPAPQSAPAPEPDPEPDDEPDEDEEEQVDGPRAFEPQPGYWPRPHLPATLTHIPDRAEAAISRSTRRLLYNGTAAGAGWALGLYQPFAHAIADCATTTSIGGALVLGIGSTVLIAHVWDRRTRRWWPGIAWCARIPLATAVLALALWAPAAT